jgi:Sulfatase-modifying factor enzyme 1
MLVIHYKFLAIKKFAQYCLFLLGVIFGDSSFACSLLPPDQQPSLFDVYKSAQYVLIVELSGGLEYYRNIHNTKDVRKIRNDYHSFSVKKWIKGKGPESILLKALQGPCDFVELLRPNRFMVYAEGDLSTGKLSVYKTDHRTNADLVNLLASYQELIEQGKEPSPPIKNPWISITQGQECSTIMAGHGKRAKAVCYDLVYTGWHGPLMVVVPPGESFNATFAIGRYEISVGDYSKYCTLSSKCKPETNKERHNDPLVDITIAQTKEYIQWLSERTGKNYRLPKKDEWVYAANADDNQPKKDVNCRLELNGKLLKGAGINSVKSGKSNGWGLRNYIGNVQEWVTDDSGNFLATGGTTGLNTMNVK